MNIRRSIKLLFWNINRPLEGSKFIPRIIQNDPDVIVLVEVRLKRKEGKRSIPVGIKPFEELTKIYDYVIHESKDVPAPGEDGILIFWRKDIFECLASTGRVGNLVKAIHVRLRHIESDTSLSFLPIHLKAGYNSGENKRVEEIDHCINFLDVHCQQERIVICGDFNDDLKDERKLSMVLKNGNFKIWDGTPTCFVGDRYWSFDRIVTCGDLEVINEYMIDPLPNETNPSDHLPVEVYLLW
jgi:exonuclease III